MNSILRRLLLSLVLLVAGIASAEPAATKPSAAPTTAPKPPARPRVPEDALTPAATLNPKRQAANFERKKDDKIQLVFLGDSITQGWSANPPLRGKEVWKAYYEKYDAANFGISAEHTEHVLGHLEKGLLDGLHPKVVVLLIGTNNIGHTPADRPEWAAAGVQKICQVVHEKCPDSKLLLLAVFPRDGKDSAHRKAVLAINAIISKLDDGNKTRYLDIGEKFLDENGEINLELMPDHLHPNAAGYEIWAKAMQPLLDEMMK